MKSFRFTTTRLEELSCPDGSDRVYVRDEGSHNLLLCCTASGSKSFYIYRRIGGRPARVRLGAWPGELSIDDARKAAQKAHGQIADGIDPRARRRAERAEMTFGELWEKHLEHAKSHNKTWKENQRQYEKYLKMWRARRISDITRDEVQAFHSRMGEKNGRYMANRTLALISHIYAKTAASAGYTGPNPAAGVERFKEKSRDRFLRADELPQFFQALEIEPDPFPDFFKLALMTGARRSNIQAMRWSDIDFIAVVWRIPETKTGEPVTIPLVPEAVAILEKRKLLAASEYVFPSHGRTGHISEPKTAWRRILERAGLSNLRLHDLRRTFGSYQAAAGVSLHTIGKSMGHKNQSTTAIYARLAMDPIREGVTSGVTKMLEAAKSKTE